MRELESEDRKQYQLTIEVSNEETFLRNSIIGSIKNKKLDDDYYFCHSFGILDKNLISDISVYNIFKSRLLIIKDNRVSFAYLDNRNAQFDEIFKHNFNVNILRLKESVTDIIILVEKDNIYDEIDRLYSIHSNQDLLSILYSDDAGGYIKYLLSKNKTVLRELFLSIIFYLTNDLRSIYYIQSAIELTEGSEAVIKKYVKRIYDFYKVITPVDTQGLLFVHDAVSKINSSIVVAFNNITKMIDGSAATRNTEHSFEKKEETLTRIKESNSQILILYGDGGSTGYELEKDKTVLGAEELGNILLQNKVVDCIIDCTCSGNYYSRLKKDSDFDYLKVIGNIKQRYASFSTNSAYFYLLGFLSKDLDDYDRSHEFGLLTMSMYSSQYLDTFVISD